MQCSQTRLSTPTTRKLLHPGRFRLKGPQLALSFGADDLDGSVVEYKITHDADAYGTPTTMHREDLLHLIWDAGFQPVERNTRYEVVREYDRPPSLAERRSEPQQVWA